MTRVVPVQDYLTVAVIPPDPTFAAGQLLLPSDAVEKSQQGIVEAVGPGKYSNKAVLIPVDIQPGDHILFAKYTGTELTVDDKTLILLRESDVLAKFVRD